MHIPQDIWTKVSSIILWVFLLFTPYSIAIHSICLGLMVLVICGWYGYNHTWLQSIRMDAVLTWCLIPIAYLLSLFYTHDFMRGWHQWTNMTPLLILPLFFKFLIREEEKPKLIIGFAIACSTSVLLHFWAHHGLHLFSWHSTSPLTLFYTASKNAWIWWSALVLLILYKRTWLHIILMLILGIGLMYLGYLSLLISAGIWYIISDRKRLGAGPNDLWVKLGVFLPTIFLSAWVLFDASHSTLLMWYETGLSFYTKSNMPLMAEAYFQDAHFSINQWWMHPFNGVGLGDYIHAMWNEYNTHGLQVPDSPAQGFLHFAVSCGMIAVVALVMIYKSYNDHHKTALPLAIFLILHFVVFVPLISTISAAVLLLPILLSPSFQTEPVT
ncbi:MAG: hypothetical protein KA109_12890 [Saprospiraceae bacterium]|nr:hypothetical protein [Saprospiraceae bacterium]MBK7436741.1 hypothetical protein [Saprospiraceae bacterium]MBK8279289.1 hypothetical protein [Saprospiraceae bacterium]MBP7802515.1 hypothetical protein [Saprospiraceae bacterium]MBP7922305.1 hypothetical protein [Saprospiraceae bacterium]